MTTQLERGARIRIESSGDRLGTRLTVDGKPLDGVTRVMWYLDAKDGIASAVLHVDAVEVDVLGDHIGGRNMPKWLLERGARSRLMALRGDLRFAFVRFFQRP